MVKLCLLNVVLLYVFIAIFTTYGIIYIMVLLIYGNRFYRSFGHGRFLMLRNGIGHHEVFGFCRLRI